MSHGSDDSDNYWPGYVDALTSMVQVLAFVMMMLAMAVFVLSQSVTKHAVEAIAKAANAEVGPNSNMKQLTQAIIDKLKSLAPPAPASEVDNSRDPTTEKHALKPAENSPAANDSTPDKPVGLRVSGVRTRSDPPTALPADAVRMTIGFAERSSKVEQEYLQPLKQFVDDNRIVERAQEITITAYAYSGDGALSEARRLAYYRAMITRKELVQAKIRAENIRVAVNDTTDKARGSTVEMTSAGNSNTR